MDTGANGLPGPRQPGGEFLSLRIAGHRKARNNTLLLDSVCRFTESLSIFQAKGTQPIINSAAMDENDRQLFTFLLLTFAFSLVFYFLIIKSGHIGSGGGSYLLCLMWSPGVAALLTSKIFHRDLGTLGWKWGKARYQALSYFIPLLYAAITYGAAWVFHLGGFYDQNFIRNSVRRFGSGIMPAWAGVVLFLLFAATTGMIRSCANTLGEEIGWRGFLVPHLAQRYGLTATAIITGVVISLWNAPLVVYADYGMQTWYGLICFTLMVIGTSFVTAWLRLKSGSLWTGVLFHASHQVFIQGVFDPLTTNTGRTKYITGEFGCGLALVCLALGIYFWSRRKELELPRESSAAAVRAIGN
jgi:membrane protease YdiL (CAAX protease family)